VFDFALDELGVSAVDAWMIGDSLVNDIAGAQAAGVYAIWVD
jgi:FMN phosphatase YigB (HAD superfamily)